ncbi:hypothetical protein L6452_27982 [Arctium lappa]|uniref:Uncharacterized protein n=1 Tax=Arctium lappa TaxID=4217 RepID=A0ACB8ZY65_ARCLA|nr:hypothetical protein L6452_27982 [Arctium lappa]
MMSFSSWNFIFTPDRTDVIHDQMLNHGASRNISVELLSLIPAGCPYLREKIKILVENYKQNKISYHDVHGDYPNASPPDVTFRNAMNIEVAYLSYFMVCET